MGITLYPEMDPLVEELGGAILEALGAQVVGIYVYGSLVTGDFDAEHSDLDLLTVTAGELAAGELGRLEAMHAGLAAAHPRWRDRVEVAYLSREALGTFRTRRSPIAIVSPGEPFHVKEAGQDWLINWWVVRRQGVALYGPEAAAVIGEIGDEEFGRAVRAQVGEWQGYVWEMTRRKSQAYAILTMCRALHAAVVGEQVSKVAAARWAAGYFPAWRPLIEDAWAWRVAPEDEEGGGPEADLAEEGPERDAKVTLGATVRFVAFAGEYLGVAAPGG
jgi:predicted nucleotidyltransferase